MKIKYVLLVCVCIAIILVILPKEVMHIYNLIQMGLSSTDIIDHILALILIVVSALLVIVVALVSFRKYLPSSNKCATSKNNTNNTSQNSSCRVRNGIHNPIDKSIRDFPRENTNNKCNKNINGVRHSEVYQPRISLSTKTREQDCQQ
jgi:uncharacterized membrane protein required for colicin V production